jgi:hypothetical protein
VDATPEADDYEIVVTANVKWTVTSDKPDVATVTPASGDGNGTFKITVSENSSVTDTRVAIITVSGEDVESQTITVTQAQAGPMLSIDTDKIDATAEGTNKEIQVTSNLAWTVTSSDIKVATVTPESGKGTGKFTIKVSANVSATTERSATITVSGNGIESKTITIAQAKATPILSVDKSTIAAIAAAQDYTIKVTSNIAWTVASSDTDVATVTPASGSNDGTLTISVSANTSKTATRTATITVKGTGVKNAEIVITQAVKTWVQPADGTWAYSNIYWDGSKLTFAVEPDATVEQYQGLFFQWGSLIGLSPVGSFSVANTVKFKPEGFTGNIGSWYSIPHTSDKVDKLSGHSATTGKGDICQYISDQEWVDGKWRMPTRAEFTALGSKPEWNDGAVSENKDDGTAPVLGGYTVATVSRFFPASGYRTDSGSLNLGTSPKRTLTYWTSENSILLADEAGYWSSNVTTRVATVSDESKQRAMPIRCVADTPAQE